MEKIFTVEIEETNIEGNGIVKIDGCIIFVLEAVKGDVITAEITQEKKNFKIAEIRSIIKPSKNRCNPDCESFELCGGCSLRHINYEHELEIKKSSIEAAFRRNGLKGYYVNEIISGNPTNYRNKAVIHFSKSGWGFLEEGTNNCIDVDECHIYNKKFFEIAKFTYDYFSKVSLPSYLALRINKSENEITCIIGCDYNEIYKDFSDSLMDNFPIVGIIYKAGNTPEEGTSYTCIGRNFLNTDFLGMNLTVSSESFFQVNYDVAEKLCEAVSSFTCPNGNEYGADLYCGTGIIGMSIAKLCPTSFITGVEINAKAIDDAKKNSAINGLSNIGFFCGDSADFAKSIYGSLDFITIDPPRKGCSEKMLKELIHIKPKRITYVSCDPNTLARDLSKLCEKLYKIEKIVAADLFPRTKHVETIVLLSRD